MILQNGSLLNVHKNCNHNNWAGKTDGRLPFSWSVNYMNLTQTHDKNRCFFIWKEINKENRAAEGQCVRFNFNWFGNVVGKLNIGLCHKVEVKPGLRVGLIVQTNISIPTVVGSSADSFCAFARLEMSLSLSIRGLF